MHPIYRRTCRACGSAALTKVIDLGEQYLQGSFVKPGKEMPPSRKVGTALVRCDPTKDENACGLLQLAVTLPPKLLYSAYWYRSGTNRTMRDHLRGIAEEGAAMIQPRPDAKVLDIGCNDGTLLNFYPARFRKFGIDPSDVGGQLAEDIALISGLYPCEELEAVVKDRPFDIITSIAMFYDLEDPVSFVRSIKRHLAPDGVWIFEMSYMPLMLEMGSYDTICHEHLEYYSLAVLEFILKRAGLKIVDTTLNDINGGSIRCYATHVENIGLRNADAANRLTALRQAEFEKELDTDKPYVDFQNRINILRHELVTLLTRLKKESSRIHVYGASTKGNTILQFCGLDNRIISHAADRNPDKYGAFTLGTDIPIISEAESRAMKPDYYLVLPWHFRKEFLEREKETLRTGVGMIFPLPQVEIVRA